MDRRQRSAGVSYKPTAVEPDWLRSSARTVLNSWSVILACVVVGGLAGYFVTTQQRPTYESTAVIYQTPRTGDSDGVSRQRSEAYTELLTSERLVGTAIEAAGIDMSIKEVQESTVAAANTGSAILTVTTTTDDPEKSAKLANALADTLPQMVAELDGDQPTATEAVPPPPQPVVMDELKDPEGYWIMDSSGNPIMVPEGTPPVTEYNPDGTPVIPSIDVPTESAPSDPAVDDAAVAGAVRLSVVTPAVPNFTATGPSYVRNVGLGLALGVLVGLCFAYLRARLSRKVEGAAELSEFLSGPLLASIPVSKAVKETGVVDFRHLDSSAAEAFRRLRTAISDSELFDSKSGRIVVASPNDGDGKTIAAINLAIALGANGSDVVLVDADLPTIVAKSAGRGRPGDVVDSSHGGLVGYLEGNTDISAFTVKSRHTGLSVIPSGGAVVNPSELLDSARMRAALAELAVKFDYVIVDTASLQARSDAIVLSRSANATMVLARSNKTRYTELSASLQRFETANIPLLGVVLNGYPRKWPVSRPHRKTLSIGQLLTVSTPSASSSNVAFLNGRPAPKESAPGPAGELKDGSGLV